EGEGEAPAEPLAAGKPARPEPRPPECQLPEAPLTRSRRIIRGTDKAAPTRGPALPRRPSPTRPGQTSTCSRSPSARLATQSHAHGRRGTSPAQHRGPPIGASTKWGRLVQNLSPPGRFKRALAPTAKRTVSRLRGGAGRLRISPTPAGRDNSPVGPVGR